MAYLNNTVSKGSHVLLLVSMQVLNQTGKQFDENVTLLLEDDSIEEVSLLLSDELHRHNLVVDEDLGEEEARVKARELTQQWITGNKKSLEALKAKGGTVYLFGDFLKDSAFQHHKERVLQLDETNKAFASNVATVANIFYERHVQKKLKKDVPVDVDKIKRHMKAFLLEETAMMIYLGTREDFGVNKNRVVDYRVYPGKTPSPLKKAYDILGTEGRMKPLMILEGERKSKKKNKKTEPAAVPNGVPLNGMNGHNHGVGYGSFFYGSSVGDLPTNIGPLITSFNVTTTMLFEAYTKELDFVSKKDVLQEMTLIFAQQLPILLKQFEKNQKTELVNGKHGSHKPSFNGVNSN